MKKSIAYAMKVAHTKEFTIMLNPEEYRLAIKRIFEFNQEVKAGFTHADEQVYDVEQLRTHVLRTAQEMTESILNSLSVAEMLQVRLVERGDDGQLKGAAYFYPEASNDGVSFVYNDGVFLILQITTAICFFATKAKFRVEVGKSENS